jgi:membrane fusion protein (multidrug efflux system)
MKRNITTIIIIIGALGLIGYVLMKNKAENEEKIAIVASKNASVSVKATQVKNETVSLDFVANGNFEPIQELTFSAEKSGKVISVLTKEGDRVSVGQTLAIVRGDVIDVNAKAAEAAYMNAKSDYNRFENAYKTGGVTKQQLDQAKLGLINAESNLKQAKINVGDTRIKAPINGIINKKHIEPGSMLAAMPATALFDIVNVSKLKLKVTVSEAQVASLKVGNTINIKTSIYPDKAFTGRITFIAAKADTNLNFPVEIEVANNSNQELKAGMYGTAKLKKVTAGRILGDKVEIISGLTIGETVITTGQINLQDGVAVEIIK